MMKTVRVVRSTYHIRQGDLDCSEALFFFLLLFLLAHVYQVQVVFVFCFANVVFLWLYFFTGD